MTCIAASMPLLKILMFIRYAQLVHIIALITCNQIILLILQFEFSYYVTGTGGNNR